MTRRIGITIGDPAGIGPEIVIKALLDNALKGADFQAVVFGHPAILRRECERLGYDVDIRTVNQLDENTHQNEAGDQSLVCFHRHELDHLPSYGRINGSAGQLAYYAVNEAVEQALQKNIAALVTAPVHKESFRLGDVPYRDHTELLKAKSGAEHAATLFVCHKLRIFFFTRHLPFKEIAASLDATALTQFIERCNGHLKTLGFDRPTLALAALNPHASDEGLFGDEEERILNPAIASCLKNNIVITGPVPADAVFHMAKEGRYDAVIALYHDQGHIAAKTYDFYRTVSLTLGLPFLRTSVDHGTAFDLAGKNKANPASMIEAIRTAMQYGK